MSEGENSKNFKKKIKSIVTWIIKKPIIRTIAKIISFGIMHGIGGIVKKILEFILKLIVYIISGKEGGDGFFNKCQKLWLLHFFQKQKKYKILNEWKNVWNHHGLKDEENNCNDTFYELFIENYYYASLKKEKNKKNNFRWKYVFLFVFLGSFLFCCSFFYHAYTKDEVKVLQSLISSGILFLLMMMACGVISKLLDIRKYQETWVRHSSLIHMLDQEMLLYIYGMEPYNQIDKEEKFMLKILDIWGKNQKKFKQNMEQKENEVMDIFKKLKEWGIRSPE